MAEDGDRVEVHYTGTLDNGDVFDSSRDREEPLTFVMGQGQLIAGFEDAVRGMEVGDTKQFRIEPEDAYGEHLEERVVEFPLDQAPEGLEAGDTVMLSSGGQATVQEVDEERGVIVIDANHPLAGEALTFDIEVTSIEKDAGGPTATPAP